MTIATVVNKVTAQGNGAVTAFSFSFLIPAASNAVVTVTDPLGVQTVLTALQYTLTGIGNANGGTLNYPLSGSPLATGYSITLQRVMPLQQLTSLINQAGYFPAVVEGALDNLEMQIQQLAGSLGGNTVLQFPAVDAPNLNAILPAAAARANMLLSFDSSGNVAAIAPAAQSATALSTQLANTASALQGAALVGYNAGLTYAAGTVGGALQAITTSSLSSIASLRAQLITGLPLWHVTGYYAAGDGGGGLYRYDSTDTTSTDNGGTIIVASDGGRWKLLWASTLNVLQFGAKASDSLGDASTNRVAFQNCVNALGNKGGTVLVPAGIYQISDSAGACLKITVPVVFQGQGQATCIKPASTVNAASHIIQFVPNPAVNCAGTVLRNFFIGDPTNGTRYGLSGIFIDTQVASAQVKNLLIEGVYIGQNTGATSYGIYHLNNPANNVNGGMFGSTIRNNVITGGIYLDGSGDSINIYDNIISDLGGSLGAGYNQIGIYASMVTGAGQLNIERNNITTTGGAIVVDKGRRVHIMFNNIEQPTTGGHNSAMIDINGGVGTVYDTVIYGNNLGAFTSTGIVYNIRTNNAVGVTIENNTFLYASSTAYAIGLFASTNYASVKWNKYDYADANRRVMDGGGIGHIGVARQLTLQNGWGLYNAAFSDAWYIKDSEGYVTISGTIAGGTATNGTILANLPVDYRPAKSEYFPTFAQTVAPAVVPGNILVTAVAGNIVYVTGDTALMSIACRFLAVQSSVVPSGLTIYASTVGMGVGYDNAF